MISHPRSATFCGTNSLILSTLVAVPIKEYDKIITKNTIPIILNILNIDKDLSSGFVNDLKNEMSLLDNTFLTNREIEILKFISKGYTNKQLCDELFISLNTVKTHITNIFNKLNVRNRTQAIKKIKELNITLS